MTLKNASLCQIILKTIVYLFQTLLTECVAPHMEKIGVVKATASAGNASYVYKMFRYD